MQLEFPKASEAAELLAYGFKMVAETHRRCQSVSYLLGRWSHLVWLQSGNQVADDIHTAFQVCNNRDKTQ